MTAPGAMTVGINYPWYSYGLDFGPGIAVAGVAPSKASPRWDTPLPVPVSSRSSRRVLNTHLDLDLDMMREAGIEIVRWFILADGWSLGTPTYSNGKWSYALPKAISEEIFKDFRTVLQAFKKAQMKIIPVLVDFLMFADGTVVLSNDPQHPASPKVEGSFYSVDDFAQAYFNTHRNILNTKDLPDWNTYIKGGKGSLLTNRDARLDFIQRIFKPLLNVAKEVDPAVVFAWDICNEPDEGVENHALRVPDLGDFLMACLQTAVDAGARTTIGFKTEAGPGVFWSQGSFGDVLLKRFETLQVYYPQYHFYPEDNPKATLAVPNSGSGQQSRSRTILGEFGTDFNGAWWQPWLATWPADVQKRLQRASDGGFGYALPWAYHPGWRSNWNDAAWAGTKAFTRVK